MKKLLTTITLTTLILIALLTPTASLNQTAKAEPTSPTLTVTGLVENPLNLTLTEIKAMPKTTLYAAIICVDFPTTIVEQGNWTGIRIRSLLETAKIKQEAVKIVFAAADGYSSGLTVEDAMKDDVVLAYEKDGQALSGLRLVVPGKWGYKWVNQVARLEAVNFDYLGFWESRGYSDRAEISEGQQAPSSINLPKPSLNQPNPSTPTSPTSTAPTPTPSQSSNPALGELQEPEQTANANQGYWIPLEAVYAVAAAVVVALGIAVLTVKKKKTKL